MKDAGIITFYNLVNTAEDGDMPIYSLSPATRDGNVLTYQFEERLITYERQYAAFGVNNQVDMLVRTWRAPVQIGMYAILTQYEGQENEAGDQYHIDNVQQLHDSNGLKVTDISLHRIDQNYAVNNE